jgi:hypothetical protein
MHTQKTRAILIPLFVLLVSGLSLVSCIRMGERSLRLQPNPVLTGGLGWAVVKEAYVRLKESPSDSAKDLDHLRRGGVFRLEARELGAAPQGNGDSRNPAAATKSDERGIWYELESEGARGWVRESELDIFQAQAQAERSASEYR